jgi:hypothetical protein
MPSMMKHNAVIGFVGCEPGIGCLSNRIPQAQPARTHKPAITTKVPITADMRSWLRAVGVRATLTSSNALC